METRKAKNTQFKWIRFLLIILIFNCSSIQIVFGSNKGISIASSSSVDNNYITELKEVTITQLADVIRFNIVSNEYSLWKLDDYIFKCAGDTGYDCELFFNKKIVKVDLSREYDIVDFLPYIYQSKVEDYPYKVILVEAGAERGTAWYYVIIMKNGKVIDSFFIDQGRRYFTSTKEYLANHPEADEMYISPKEFISIFIDDKKEIIFRFDKKYLYESESTTTEDKDFVYISKELLNND